MDITSVNAKYTLAISGVFNTPQLLQGWAVDDAFDTEPVDAAEVLMGLDGFLSAGFIYVPYTQNLTLQADSPSNNVFDSWYNAQRATQGVFPAAGTILIPSINKKYAMVNGVLRRYPSIPDAKRTLTPRRYTLVWQLASPAPA